MFVHMFSELYVYIGQWNTGGGICVLICCCTLLHSTMYYIIQFFIPPKHFPYYISSAMLRPISLCILSFCLLVLVERKKRKNKKSFFVLGVSYVFIKMKE